VSLRRLVYYSTMLAGWAAFFGWLVSEKLRGDVRPGAQTLLVVLTAGVTGAALGLGLNVVAGMSNGQWRQLLRRAGPGLAGGGIGGIAGGVVGNVLYGFGWPRALGWLIMGLGIGIVEGLYEKSGRKIRNGLLGGAIGGLLGGLLFDPIVNWTATDSGMSSRATAFVVLGLCIGASISLAQVVLMDAWLTVVDGYRTGRQLNLTQAVTVLGRSDRLPLPFLGLTNKDLDPEHLRIMRCPDGSYALEDNDSKLGTWLNSQPVKKRVALKDGDVIRLSTNLVRFNQRQRRAGQGGAAGASPLAHYLPPAPPPARAPTAGVPAIAPPPAPPPPPPGWSPAKPWRSSLPLPPRATPDKSAALEAVRRASAITPPPPPTPTPPPEEK
jgi:hypothetical protein